MIQGDGVQRSIQDNGRPGPEQSGVCYVSWLAQMRRMSALLAQHLRRFRLTLGEYEVLSVLQHGPLAQAVICQRTDHSGASVSRWLDYLEAEGWVRRERPERDRRRCFVRLTEAGSRHLHAAGIALAVPLDELELGLGATEKRSLGRLYRNIERLLGSGGAARSRPVSQGDGAEAEDGGRFMSDS